MADDLQEAAVVTEDVREQASSLGYELRREVAQIIGQDGRLWPASDDSPIPGKRCHIVSQRGPFAGFRFGPYETKEEAETKGLAEILHWHARAKRLARGFRVAHSSGPAASGFVEGRHEWYVRWQKVEIEVQTCEIVAKAIIGNYASKV